MHDGIQKLIIHDGWVSGGLGRSARVAAEPDLQETPLDEG